MHRYYPDFYIKVKTQNNEIKQYILEIKPIKDTVIKESKRMEDYVNNVLTVSKNKCKWEAAQKFCKQHNLIFKVLTEKELFGTK
jgi:hypothetical protein